MGFLAPWWLLLAGAAAVPLLLHLLRRRIGARVDFPAVRYIERAEREHSRRLRLRNLLLMLVRVLVLLLVALAAARPVARLAGAGHEPTALAIVLDNSMSTSVIVEGAPLLDRLRAAARETVERAAPGDRLWLVTADGAVRGGSQRAILDALDEAPPIGGAGNLADAVTRAGALVRTSGLARREVAILTDAQASSWRRGVTLPDADVSIHAPDARVPANRAVTGAVARPERWTPAGAVEATMQVPGEAASYRVAIAGSGATGTIARGTAQGGGVSTITARATPSVRGWTGGFVELEPDELRGDDRRWFAVWVGAPPAITIAPSSGAFARAAADALVASGRARAGSGVAIAPADEVRALPAVILPPSNPVRIGAANRNLERLGIPWRFGAVRRAEADARAADGAPPLGEETSVRERYALDLRPGAPTDTLARVADEPWVVAGNGYVVLGSVLDPAATSFPLRASFVPWLADILSQRLGTESGAAVAAGPGDSVRVPAGATALEGVDGSRVALAGASVAAPASAGVYFFLRDGRRVGALAVNPEAEESVLDRLSLDRLEERVTGDVTRAFADARTWGASLLASAGRRPLGAPLLVAALVLLALESLLTRHARRPLAA